MSEEAVEQISDPQEEAIDPTPAPVKQKRPMSEEALGRLAEARKIALQVRQAKSKEKLLAKAAAIPVPPSPAPAPEQKTQKKSTRQPLPEIVIEQSDSDDDEYENPPNQIVVVKKRAPKVKAEAQKKEEEPPAREFKPTIDELIKRQFVRT